ncbi:MAG: peptidase C11 [Clostridia bacterium]|nr:peptidase C11 [Clostridia bacterium]
MNNTPGSGGRKTNVTGNANVGKGEKVGTTGPVGRQDGYAGKTGGGQQRPQTNSGARGILLGNSRGGSIGRIVAIIAVIAIVFVLYRTCSGGCSLPGIDTNDVLSQFISQGYNNYDASDAQAPTAPSASTSATSADLSVASSARAKRTVLKGNGSDTVTIMVYMCGTDLESKYGMATNDLNEMLHAELNDDKINVIVETGGTKTWKNSVISSSINQRWRVRNSGLQKLQDLTKKNMTDPATLSDFIKYCKSNYPADRYMLIFWDHGGGALTGYGYDQNYSGSMTLDKINKALKDGGTVFDFIGFDACLMATMETALVAEQYADYLIGSEETEPGCGWYYTNWLTELSRDTSISTVKLGKRIVDDFNDVCKKNNSGDATTLSVIDLAEFAGAVPQAFSKFAANVSELIDGDDYSAVANARSGAREFGKSAGINHVDLVHLAMRINTDEANKLVEALLGCIKYNRTSTSMANSYGISIYFPLSSFSGVGSAVKLYDSIGMDENYTAAVRSFASLAAGGQLATGTTSSPIGSLLGSYLGTSSGTSSQSVLSTLLGGYLSGGSDTSGGLLTSLLGSDYSSWFDGERVMANTDYYDTHAIYSDDMELTQKNGGWVLSMSSDKWAMVNSVQLNLFVDDGEGYIDLGMDNVYRFDSDGDLVIESDRSWLALNGQIVPYYMISEVWDGDNYTITGRVPAMLNGELVYVIIVFDNETPQNEYGYVAGARYIYDDYETDTLGRGLIAIKDGDKLEFICDYYRYDGTYEGSYKLGNALIVNGAITVSNVTVNDLPVIATWCLTDIYGNEFWTESRRF